MTEPIEITAEMVMAVASLKRRDHAERVAAYATHRFAGLLPIDAARESREAATPPETRSRWEKFLPLLAARYGLPDPPKVTHGLYKDAWGDKDRAARGGHQGQHVARGIVKPGCPLCECEAGAS